MSLIESQESFLPERDDTRDDVRGGVRAEVEQNEVENLRLVPVSESIRYRKRAQSAEKKNEALSEQLAEARSEASKLSEQLNEIKIEQKLTEKLAVAGAVDLETAVLIAKAKMKDETEADLEGVVEQLKKEKQYLFDSESGRGIGSQKTSGVKERMVNNRTALARAAKKAAVTGNRADLQEYLKLRRNVV